MAGIRNRHDPETGATLQCRHQLRRFILLTVVAGGEQMAERISSFDSVEQALAVLLLLLLTSMLAFVLRAISRPLLELFSGEALPRVVADWSTRGQLRAGVGPSLMSRANPG